MCIWDWLYENVRNRQMLMHIHTYTYNWPEDVLCKCVVNWVVTIKCNFITFDGFCPVHHGHYDSRAQFSVCTFACSGNLAVDSFRREIHLICHELHQCDCANVCVSVHSGTIIRSLLMRTCTHTHLRIERSVSKLFFSPQLQSAANVRISRWMGNQSIYNNVLLCYRTNSNYIIHIKNEMLNHHSS